MRQIITIAAALAMFGVSDDLASAQGQGKNQGESKALGQKGGNTTSRDRTADASKTNSGAQNSRSEKASAGKNEAGNQSVRVRDRVRENGDEDAGRNGQREQASDRASVASNNGNAAEDRGESRGDRRDYSSNTIDKRSRSADDFNSDQRARKNRDINQRDARRADSRDQANFSRVAAKRPQFAFVQSDYLIAGCPPGLAKKNNGCIPPGQQKQRPLLNYGADFFGYRDVQDGRYRYGDGYLYRLNDSGGLLGFIPLLGGALSIGNIWPQSYQRNQVPDYYAEYYNLGPPRNYGYADDVIYRLNPQSSTITSIAALLTGDEFRVGERAPDGYDIYNVPSAYRDDYRDRPEAAYRYSDGYIYEIDPTTQLVRAAIELLV